VKIRRLSSHGQGFTLIEIVVFIVIVGVSAYALFRSFTDVLPRSPTQSQMVQATHLAQERMELIVGRRAVAGYNAAQLDPCKIGAAPICTDTLGFGVTSLGTGTAASVPPDPARQWNTTSTADYKLVTVTVRLSGTPLAVQDAVLANY
jgi:type II secretory pathway pseudopilin PulG